MPRHRQQGGFTLVEVLVALLIIASTILVLLERRNAALGEASKIRERRIAWMLAAQKMAEIEMNKDLFTGEGGGSESGTFDDYEGYSFEYAVELKEEATNDPDNDKEEPKKIFFARLIVRGTSLTADDEAVKLEAYFPEQEETGAQ